MPVDDFVRLVLCARNDLAAGEMRKFETEAGAILLAKKDEATFFAIRPICPHYGADLSKGTFTGTNVASDVGVFRWGRDCELVRCPWHAWEFDLETGRSLHDPEGQRVKAYKVEIEGDDVVVHTRSFRSAQV